MKHYKIKNVKKPVLDSVICDNCGEECKNTHIEILIKFSFCDDSELLETRCFKCYEEKYDKKLKHVRDARVKMMLKGDGVQKDDE